MKKEPSLFDNIPEEKRQEAIRNAIHGNQPEVEYETTSQDENFNSKKRRRSDIATPPEFLISYEKQPRTRKKKKKKQSSIGRKHVLGALAGTFLIIGTSTTQIPEGHAGVEYGVFNESYEGVAWTGWKWHNPFHQYAVYPTSPVTVADIPISASVDGAVRQFTVSYTYSVNPDMIRDAGIHFNYGDTDFIQSQRIEPELERLAISTLSQMEGFNVSASSGDLTDALFESLKDDGLIIHRAYIQPV